MGKRFKVKGIPSLVILDGDRAEVITTDGRSAIMGDPCGESFPWRPKPFKELFGTSFLRNVAGETVGKDALEGKVVLIYFSAHWCPPCRGFTPKLAEAYKKFQAKGLPVEVIFVSGDRDEAAFKEYFGEMPWLALPFEDKQRKDQWNSAFQVRGIPSLVILDKDLATITKDGRAVIMEDPEGAEFPWHPKLPAPVGDLVKPKGIEDCPSLVVFMENATKEDQEKTMSELLPVATKFRDAAWEKKEDPKYLFFAAKSSEGPVPRVRELTKQTGDVEQQKTPKAVLLDLDDDGAYYELDGEVTTATVEAFLANFEAKTLERKQCE